MAFYSIVGIRNAAIVNTIDRFSRYRFEDRKELPADHWTKWRDTSYLGYTLFAPLEIKAGSYLDADGNEKQYGNIFLDCIETTISQTKKIQRTEITGRQGSAKELISDGDFSIDLNIELYDPTGNHPEETKERLIKILRAGTSIEVVSPALAMYDINNIVITSFKEIQSEYGNIAVFQIQAESDEPLELRITNDE